MFRVLPPMSSAAMTQSVEALSAVDPITPLLTSAALIALDDTAWLRVTGDDRVRWLNGMATNSIQALTPGQGCYTFFLNAQGRIVGDATAYLEPDAILLETSRDQLPTLLAHLEHFIIMDDVELQSLDQQAGLLLAGPDAASILASAGIDTATLAPLSFTQLPGPTTLIHAHSPLIPRFELWADPATIATFTSTLLASGATRSDTESLNQLRIAEGTPLFGTDIRNSEAARDLPQETTPVGTPSRALHFSKGCYLGQEIVERIRSRGNLHRTFSGFLLTGDLPPAGTSLFEAGAPERSDKPIGELTSITRIDLPGGPAQIALGYIRREILDRAASISYASGVATPAALPFPLART